MTTTLTWTKTAVSPDEVLDAIDTIQAGSSWYQTDLLSGWRTAEAYAGWARDCLMRDDEFGWDAAISYAKRALCRRIDGLMITNHLGHFSGRKYPEKLEMITDIGIFAPEVIHELVIDPRNDIEHAYSVADRQSAKRAVDLCDMFLKSTAEEAKQLAVISFGVHISIRREYCATPGHERDVLEFAVRDFVPPMLFIDCEHPQNHTAMILRPKDAEILLCPLKSFNVQQSKRLAQKLRPYHGLENYSRMQFELSWFPKFKADLNIPA